MRWSADSHLKRLHLGIALIGLSILLTGCSESPDSEIPESSGAASVRAGGKSDGSGGPFTPVVLVENAAESGLSYAWPQQPRPMTALDAFGSGCAAFDVDNDGWQDVLLVARPAPVLYRNLQNGRFENVSSEYELDRLAGTWTGCAMGDVNGDGWLDLLLSGYHQLTLLLNRDGRRFEDVTTDWGLDPSNHEHWGSGAAWMDLDGDQWLDLVLLNYVVYGPDTQKYCEYAPGVKSGCGPRTYQPERGEIWRNTGQGRLELVPSENGMADTHGVGLVLAFTDLDRDGRTDFYIGNDGVAADLMHNQGEMRFKNIGAVAGVATSDNGAAVSAMGADWADFDRDGHLDLAVTNWIGSAFVLFRGLSPKLYMDCAKLTSLANITRNRMGFGAKWVDYENDGWPDLFFVNGHVYDNSAEIYGVNEPYRQHLLLLSNRQGRQFQDLAPQLGSTLDRITVGRGSATADFNNDGRVDLLAVDFEGPVILLENRTKSENHWIKLDLRGQSPNHFAYGAQVKAVSGLRVWLSDVSPASSYLSSSDPRIHWGLGGVEKLDTLTIRWPSGSEQILRDVAVDRILRIDEGRN